MVVKHLPPAVKQLLTLRNPQLPLAPPVSKLSAVLRSTFEDARTRKAETGWLTLTASTYNRNKPDGRCIADRGINLCVDLYTPDGESAFLSWVSVQVRDESRP